MTKLVPESITKQSKKADNRRQVLGVGVSGTNIEQVLKKIDDFVHSSHKSSPKVVVTVNQEFVILAHRDPEFKKILNNADLAIPDGRGLRLAEPSLPTVPGRKVVHALVSSGQYNIYYLGGKDGVAMAMAKKFGGRGDEGHEQIQVELHDAQINERILQRINAYQPDIVLVAYGAPWQEKWIWANKARMQTKVIMGVGGSFDFLTGKAALPPVWMEQAGLEWLWRLMREPWRWRRQLALLEFALKTFFASF